MAGNDQGDSIRRQAAAHRPSGPWGPGLGGKLSIGHGAPEWYAAAALQDPALERGAGAKIDLHVSEIVYCPAGVSLEPLDELRIPDHPALGVAGECGIEMPQGLFGRLVPEGQLPEHVSTADQGDPANAAAEDDQCVVVGRRAHGGVWEMWREAAECVLLD
jgi:hypothetical protein